MRISRKRASIQSGFITLMQSVARDHIERILSRAERQSSPKQYLRVHRHSLMYLTPIAEGDAKAIDALKIKMHSMEYTHYGIDKFGNDNYFWAQTMPITARNVYYGRSSISGSRPDFKLGTYQIYVNEAAFRSDRRNLYPHFIPNEMPTATKRHPHVTASHQSSRDGRAKCHPMDMSVNICWGSFGPLISAAKSDRDVVEWFNLAHMYLSRWTPNDTLAPPSSIEFAQSISRE